MRAGLSGIVVTSLSGLLGLACCSGAGSVSSASIPPPAAVSAYDGVYAGDMDKITAGDPTVCGGISHKTLNVVGGVATLAGEPDTRTGNVAMDGSLLMTGSVGTPPKTFFGSLTGHFANGHFQGTSSVGRGCQYEWNLSKI